MGVRSSTWVTSALVLFVLGVVILVLPAPVVVLGPGPTFDTLGDVAGKPVVTAGGLPTYPTTGHLNMTTVGVTDGITTADALRYWFGGEHQIVPRFTLYPPDRTNDQVTSENQQEFDSSVANAEAAALSYLRLPTRVTVGALTPGSPSAGKLAEGDQLLAVGGRPVESVPMLLDTLRAAVPGRAVPVRIKRGDDPPRDVTIVPTANPQDPARAFLGIAPAMSPLAGDRISISLADVGGPSAGLMFSLALVDKLTPGALTGGRYVAGTGTITADGVVGPISGIRFKMLQARQVGATTFLVPDQNCDEAASVAPDGLQLVRVRSIGDAVTALGTLRDGGTPQGCS